MYAFAIYDRIRRKVFLVRDRGHQTPTFRSVAERPGLGTEGSAAVIKERRSASTDTVYDYLTYSGVPAPKSTGASAAGQRLKSTW
jgi:hypothetical protein